MIDIEKREEKERLKQKTKRRMQFNIDPDNYEYQPAEEEPDYYNEDVKHSVGIYVRVSTEDIRQTTSFELQKQYYEELVARHSNWTLYKIYADEGISGTAIKPRKQFLQMIDDAKNGYIDLIITKSVSRFARNTIQFLVKIEELKNLNPPVGVFFESEAIFSLKEDSQLALSFTATMADEESHTRSRSMETSLRMRLDHGIPLTPKLLGFSHDADGKLIINPEEAPTVKLIFFMYLYGYSTTQIANILTQLGHKTYLGNVVWSAGSIVEILRNERHCGWVITRKTYTPNYHDHKSKKNYTKKPKSTYKNDHEPIVSREDFIAVQHMLDNAKYRNKSYLPELRVIKEGILKGFVTINPRWSGFKIHDYFMAAKTAYEFPEEDEFPVKEKPNEMQIAAKAGDFDLRGFEVIRNEFFEIMNKPRISFVDRKIRINAEIVRKLKDKSVVELLINPVEQKFAIRTTTKENRQSVECVKKTLSGYESKDIPAAAFYKTVCSIFGWNPDYKYRIAGSLCESADEIVYIFDVDDAEAFIHSFMVNSENEPVTKHGKRIKAIPQEWLDSFGHEYYFHEQSIDELKKQNEKQWKLRIQGQLFASDKVVKTTSYEEIKAYIDNALKDLNIEVKNGN